MKYLSRFGNLNSSEKNQGFENIRNEDSMPEALMKFPSFVVQNSTGHLDKKTLQYMSMLRSDIPDTMELTSRGGMEQKFGPGNQYLDHQKIGPPGLGLRRLTRSLRSRRYVLEGSKWNTNNLSYKISKYGKRLSKSETDSEIRKAFNLWSRVTPLKFTKKKNGKVNIDIKFDRSIDGRGHVLANTYFPSSGGDIHFDDSERWSIDTDHGTNLFQVAVHEIGHALGLSHSKDRSSIMWPTSDTMSLSRDDIKGIQAIYGSRRKGPRNSDEENYNGGDEDSGDYNSEGDDSRGGHNGRGDDGSRSESSAESDYNCNG